MDGLATSFAFPAQDWSIMCANGVVGTEGWFYDTQSLRTVELPDTPSLHRRGVPLAAHVTPLHLNDDHCFDSGGVGEGTPECAKERQYQF